MKSPITRGLFKPFGHSIQNKKKGEPSQLGIVGGLGERITFAKRVSSHKKM